MNRSLRRVLLLTSVLMLAACAPRVTIDFDRTADFSQYRTYAWSIGTPTRSPLMDRRIIAAIEEQLAAKSLQKTENQPDLVVSYHAALNQEIRYNTTSIDVGYGPGWGTGYGYYGGGWGPRGGDTITTPTKITVGTLNVDIYDSKRKEMIWRGSASETLTTDRQKTIDLIKERTAAMFEKFPPR